MGEAPSKMDEDANKAAPDSDVDEAVAETLNETATKADTVGDIDIVKMVEELKEWKDLMTPEKKGSVNVDKCESAIACLQAFEGSLGKFHGDVEELTRQFEEKLSKLAKSKGG
ncbi:hypothetical protein EYR40_004851 [Pleurotus pulmonarius]|nr:hypothetical protein EYR36_006768 [Pleurotus pulmonarius]KAF4601464.1 hypothetical protein EYR38_006117 [Pleurotus pulmonarius]KAF4601652.1 hypothetical protein EYR40_004851 [Pleurotus pulmonarius]